MGPRITLISALAQSPAPALVAMADVWPEAQTNNLIDDSLASDFARLGAITPAIIERFRALGRYAAAANDGANPTRGILFTCSAFRPAIERVKTDLDIPVVTPNEGAFDEALAICRGQRRGGTIGLLLTFAGSTPALTEELHAMAEAIGQPVPQLMTEVAVGALEALQSGDGNRHDRLIAEAAERLPSVDVVIIGQFSMARAADFVRARRAEPVLTTPEMAARKLRRLVEQLET